MSRRAWLGFAALCVLSGSAWLLDAGPLLALSGLLRPAVHLGLLSVVFTVLSLRRQGPWRSHTLLPIAAWAVVLITLPLFVTAAAADYLSSFTTVLAFALVPTFTVFLVGQLRASFGEDRSALPMLLPALAAFGGLALLVPFTAPSSTAGALWLTAVLLSAALSAYAGLRLHDLLQNVPLLNVAAVASGASSLVLAAVYWIPAHTQANFSVKTIAIEAASCLLLDAPILLLTVWLLRRVDPVALSARYLLIPFVTITEGFLLLRPEPTWTMLLGAVLIAGGSLRLLRGEHQS